MRPSIDRPSKAAKHAGSARSAPARQRRPSGRVLILVALIGVVIVLGVFAALQFFPNSIPFIQPSPATLGAEALIRRGLQRERNSDPQGALADYTAAIRA